MKNAWSGKVKGNSKEDNDGKTTPKPTASSNNNIQENPISNLDTKETLRVNNNNNNNNNNEATLEIGKLSIKPTSVDKGNAEMPRLKSPFFLKQLDLSQDMINFSPKSSKSSAGKSKSKKSMNSPLQTKPRGFSTVSSNRFVFSILKWMCFN